MHQKVVGLVNTVHLPFWIFSSLYKELSAFYAVDIVSVTPPKWPAGEIREFNLFWRGGRNQWLRVRVSINTQSKNLGQTNIQPVYNIGPPTFETLFD